MNAPSRMARIACLTLAVGLIGLSLSCAQQSPPEEPVIVDGVAVAAPGPGAVVRDVIAAPDVLRAGRLLAVGDGTVLSPSEGLPATVLLNGSIASSSTPVYSGDRILTIPGADVVEGLVRETRSLDPASVSIGVGPTEKVLFPGSPGTVVVSMGSVSGQVVATETVTPGVPAVVRRVPAPGASLIALTFDDGPWPAQTEAILAILAERNVPATFFMLGSRIERAPDIARAVAHGGHVIGNHTYAHAYLDSPDYELSMWEIDVTNRIIESVTGMRPGWIRAPGGHVGGPAQEFIAQAGLRSALWTVDPKDWRDDVTPDELVWSVVGAAFPGAIVVLHDGGGDQTATIAALPQIIDGLRAAGYEFATLDEMPDVRAAW